MTRSASPPPRIAFVAAFAAVYLIWGSTYLAIRYAVETLPPFAMAGARFLLAGSVLTGVLLGRGRFRPTRSHVGQALVTGALLLLGGNGLVVWAEQEVPSGLAALIIAITPLLMVLFDWMLPGGKRPTLRTGFGLALGLAGLGLLVGPGAFPPGAELSPGRLAAVVGACVSWAIGSLYSKRSKEPADPFSAAALQMLLGGGLLTATGALRGELAGLNFATFSAESVGAFFYLVIAGSLVAFTAYAWLLKHASPARVSTYAYVNPVVAVFLGWLIADETLGPRTLAASAIIVAAVVLITLPARARR